MRNTALHVLLLLRLQMALASQMVTAADVDTVVLVSGATSISVSLKDLSVETIAPMFSLDPSRPLWIVRKRGNVAVWPRSNKFTGQLVSPGTTYKVRGHALQTPAFTSASQGSVQATVASPSPFGVFTSPSYSDMISLSHPKKKSWSKTILVVFVKKREERKSWRGNAKVDYDVVTQTQLTMDSSSCNVRWVADLLRKQLSMEVILLDSKCYPLLENDSTSSETFWKSSHKVLAANKMLYCKVSGESTDVGRASIDLTQEDTSGESDSSGSRLQPLPKRARHSAKLDEIAKIECRAFFVA